MTTITKFTKEQLIEDLKASTQNASGIFEISEDTICALMSMLTSAAPQLPQPAVFVPSIKPDWMNNEFNAGWNACRAAMLQGSQPVSIRDELSSPVIPDGYALVPERLTAENGAKSALAGEFSETKFINCPECFGDDECETCDGSGRIEITVPVSWTNIKAIWAKGVEHFAAAPQQEAE